MKKKQVQNYLLENLFESNIDNFKKVKIGKFIMEKANESELNSILNIMLERDERSMRDRSSQNEERTYNRIGDRERTRKMGKFDPAPSQYHNDLNDIRYSYFRKPIDKSKKKINYQSKKEAVRQVKSLWPDIALKTKGLVNMNKYVHKEFLDEI